jgi:hypothetical protein
LQRSIFDQRQSKGKAWADCDLDSILRNFSSIASAIQASLPCPDLIKGDACDTAAQLIGLCPNGISLLRLYMDWYEPTKDALTAALQLLRSNAIMIVDDYGHHSGVKYIIDGFLSNLLIPFDSSMTDYSCRRILFLS